jgi:K+-sensing histidine kinase KdpD
MVKILVIEDAKDLRDDIIEMLVLEGFESVGAENGIHALSLLETERPNLIICDVMMPEMDGYEVLEHVRNTPDIAATPFIFLTSKTERANVRHGMILGADDYLTKPFLVTELLETIKSQLKKHGGLNDIVNKRLNELRENITTALPHELRTPLNTIIGFSDMILNEAKQVPVEQVLEWTQHISTSAHRLYRMVENYIAYARISIAFDSPDQLLLYQAERLMGIETIVQSQASRLSQRYKREKDIIAQVETADFIQVSYSDMLKILEELLDNALKFSEPDTPINIQGDIVDQCYRLTISDKGRGITPDQTQKIGAYMQFDRWFYEQQGMGLGLAIVDRLVKIYEGKFSIESIADGGTQATVMLPLG